MSKDTVTHPRPILWSFRRCPYAIRARMAVLSAGIEVDLREIKLKDKPPAFLAASPSATVPNLQAGDLVLDESLDIMRWALGKSDPRKLLNMPEVANPDCPERWPFKAALDHTKYAVRYPGLDPQAERARASEFIQSLDARLAKFPFLTATGPCLPTLRSFRLSGSLPKLTVRGSMLSLGPR